MCPTRDGCNFGASTRYCCWGEGGLENYMGYNPTAGVSQMGRMPNNSAVSSRRGDYFIRARLCGNIVF